MKDRILNILKEEDKAYTLFELKDILGLNTTEEIEEMLKVLNELESDLTIQIKINIWLLNIAI